MLRKHGTPRKLLHLTSAAPTSPSEDADEDMDGVTPVLQAAVYEVELPLDASTAAAAAAARSASRSAKAAALAAAACCACTAARRCCLCDDITGTFQRHVYSAVDLRL